MKQHEKFGGAASGLRGAAGRRLPSKKRAMAKTVHIRECGRCWRDSSLPPLDSCQRSIQPTVKRGAGARSTDVWQGSAERGAVAWGNQGQAGRLIRGARKANRLSRMGGGQGARVVAVASHALSEHQARAAWTDGDGRARNLPANHLTLSLSGTWRQVSCIWRVRRNAPGRI